MRLSHSLALARMLLVFFARRVLRTGVLRSGPVRAMALVGIALLLVILSAAAYAVLEPMADDSDVWELLFDTSTISLVLWTQVAFLFVKTLFLNAEGILETSFQLPLTNRERATAFLIYEAVMTGVVVGAGAFSFTAAALLLLGPSAVALILVSVLAPAALTYLALSVVYLLLVRLFGLFRLRHIANVLAILSLFALAAAYSTEMMPLISAISQAYLDGEKVFVWVTAVSWLSSRHGSVVALAVAGLAGAGLVLLALGLTPNQHVRHSRYLKTPLGRLARLLGPYDLCLIRSSQTAISATLAVAGYIYLIFNPVVNPIWSLGVLSLGGLYQFTATEPLRSMVGGSVSPWRTYGLLIRAQLVLLALFAVPALVLLAVLDRQLFLQSPLVLLGCITGAVLTTCVGVIFPTEKDNPFSVFIGLSLMAVILSLVGMGLGVLNLPPTMVVASLVGACVLFVCYTVIGIQTSEWRRRNEKGAVGRERRRRVRAIDADRRGTHTTLSHVLDH